MPAGLMVSTCYHPSLFDQATHLPFPIPGTPNLLNIFYCSIWRFQIAFESIKTVVRLPCESQWHPSLPYSIFSLFCCSGGCICMHFCSILCIYHQYFWIRKCDCFWSCRKGKWNENLNAVETHQKCMSKLVSMPISQSDESDNCILISISKSEHSDNSN
jgi:hypothetical protein